MNVYFVSLMNKLIILVIHSRETGSLRRAGGQGDILAGCLGVFHLWMSRSNCSNLPPKYAAFLLSPSCIYLSFL